MGLIHRTVRLGVTVATLLLASAAQANIVTNGGFESNNFTGWTQFGNTNFTGVDGTAPHSGSFAAFFGPTANTGGSGGISQTLATTNGATYNVQFYLQNELAGTNSFVFEWDGGAVDTLVDSAFFGYTLFQHSLLASSNTTEIRFTFLNEPSFWDLDDVLVEQSEVGPSLPEPATLALLGLALAALGFSRRRNLR